MIEQDLAITNKLGLHARAAAKVVSVGFALQLQYPGDSRGTPHRRQEHHGAADAGGRCAGTTLRVCVDGEDEQPAMDELTDLFERKFDEGE